MREGQGYVVAERDVTEQRAEGDTAAIRVTIDASSGAERLEQRVVRFAPGCSRERVNADRQEVIYVAAGRGRVLLDGEPHPLEPDTGVYVAAGERYTIENPGPEELLLVSVLAPAEGPPIEARRRVTVRYAEQPALPAGEREFRFLVNEEAGCPDVTQFVGVIPAGRAPLHSHTYDEVVYIAEGEGILHLGERETPISAGSCIHLPPLSMHCLENSGTAPMRVMGVFHPSGDPASRASEDNK